MRVRVRVRVTVTVRVTVAVTVAVAVTVTVTGREIVRVTARVALESGSRVMQISPQVLLTIGGMTFRKWGRTSRCPQTSVDVVPRPAHWGALSSSQRERQGQSEAGLK